MRVQKAWTKQEIEKLRTLYKTKTIRECAEILERSFQSVKSATSKFQIKSGRTGQFKKGHTPFNKGLKLEDYVSEESIKKMELTQFKKGHIPKNYRETGSSRISRDGYLEVKIKHPAKWVLYHQYIYEKEKGKIPKGYNVIFKDGNKNNITIDNLECISNEELMRQNRISKYPLELQQLIREKNKLNKLIKELENE